MIGQYYSFIRHLIQMRCLHPGMFSLLSSFILKENAQISPSLVICKNKKYIVGRRDISGNLILFNCRQASCKYSRNYLVNLEYYIHDLDFKHKMYFFERFKVTL